MSIRPARSLIAALSLAIAGAAPAFAKDPQCGGADVIARAKVEKPQKYAAFEADARKIPNGEGLLWRIEGKGAPASYLFGTMHSTEADLVDLAPPVKEALATAKTVAVEIAGGDTPESQAKIVAYVSANGIDPSGKGLDGLTEAQAGAVRTRMAAAGLPGDVVPMLKPWFLGVTLATSACELKQMAGGKLTVDGVVEKTGREAGARIVGLETVEEQLGAVAKIDDETARRMIRDAVASETASDDMQATTLALYRARRVGWYFATKAETFGDAFDLSAYKDFVEDIVDRRNRLMLERSEAEIEKGSTFIAVGALHLPGRNGLVELLRGKGYEVVKVW